MSSWVIYYKIHTDVDNFSDRAKNMLIWGRRCSRLFNLAYLTKAFIDCVSVPPKICKKNVFVEPLPPRHARPIAAIAFCPSGLSHLLRSMLMLRTRHARSCRCIYQWPTPEPSLCQRLALISIKLLCWPGQNDFKLQVQDFDFLAT